VWDGTSDTTWFSEDENAFLINTPEQLAGLAELVNGGNDMSGKSFSLTTDLYLGEDESNVTFTPIAKMTSGVEFSGIFDGKGHTIYRLYRYEDGDADVEGGLFGSIGKYGVVRNVKIDQSYVRAHSGAIAAYNYGSILFCENSGLIENPYIWTSSSTMKESAGGIAACNFGTIYGCVNKGRGLGWTGYVGGIAGYNSSLQGCVKCCYNSGYIACGGWYAAGIVGENSSLATVEDCFNIGVVVGELTGSFTNYSDSAGIVGFNNNAYIVNCFSTASGYRGNADSDPICVYNKSENNKAICYCYALDKTAFGTQISWSELTSANFVDRLNSVDDFYEIRLRDIWMKGDDLPVTIAQKANESGNYKFDPTACITQYDYEVSETHFGYAITTFESSNEDILSVDSEGKITWTGNLGTAYIIMTIPETEVSNEEIHVLEYTKYGIKYVESNITIKVGETITPEMIKVIRPDDDLNLVYKIYYNDVASIDDHGAITGKAEGTAEIDVYDSNDYYTYNTSCTVTVVSNPDDQTVSDISKANIDFVNVVTKSSGGYWVSYDGAAKKPKVKVTLKGKELVSGTDYSVSYASNKNVGTAKVTVKGIGNYSGTVSKNFLICFKDVPMTHNFQKAVYWAVDQGIAAGYSGDKTGTFGVSDDITRGQVVLFLWRAAGQPKAKDLKSQTFSDVKTSSAFYKAIQWAVEEGIVGGYKDGTFRPSDNCTRGQIAMFLWRYDGKKAPAGKTQTFTDVPTSSNFYKAIQWAAEEGITAGYKDGTFGINKSCTRGHCVTFLYRLLVD